MSNTLSLATRLKAMRDADLARTMRARSIGAAGIKDFFDLAEAFLDPVSIQDALSHLDRPTLAILAAASECGGSPSAGDVAALLSSMTDGEVDAATVERRALLARELLLLEEHPHTLVAYDAVRERLLSWPESGLPSLAELAKTHSPGALEPLPDVDQRFTDRLGVERAFTATTAVTELLVEVEREPARELAKGGVGLPDTKRLASSMSVDLESVASFLAVADRADLAARETGSWMITERGAAWLLESTGGRWAALASAWLDRLPADIRVLLAHRTHTHWGHGLRGYLDWLYPAGGEWMDDRVSTYTRDAELLGITANNNPTTPGSLLLAEGAQAAAAAMAALLPAEVEQVYLQHDLSIVAPGPLTPQVDSRLRAIADMESRALASSYRVSTSSVNRAMASGESAASMLAFLRSISLTGIPQPLQYLIEEAASRYGQVRVGRVEDESSGAQSYIRSSDELLIGTVLVDQNLTSLGFVRTDPTRATSRFAIDVVFWSVSDARYPVAAENADGEIIALRRQRAVKSQPTDTSNPIAALIERLRLGAAPEGEGTGQEWLIRQLDVAIRAKSSLTISVTMPNGTMVDYQLEPTSVTGGRLRGRDNKAAIERTLPLSRIAAITPAG
ncbi:MAG: hypothetical protein JWM49_861 [Microbacteriaceae bacterium]|nr:hypothetical protein [Microbacteriaceae bacterium]